MSGGPKVDPELYDQRYDTAAVRAYAANVVAFWAELIVGGMDQDSALQCVLEFMRTALSAGNAAND